MNYKQLTLTKRYHILALIKEGYNQKDIAIEIGVHPSTICRELREACPWGTRSISLKIILIINQKKHIFKLN